MIIENLSEIIFKYLPLAKIGGEYAVYRIMEKSELCNQIEVIIDEIIDPNMDKNIDNLKKHLQNNGWLTFCKFNEYYFGQIKNLQLFLTINNREYEIKIECNNYDQTFFHATNIQIDKSGVYSPRYNLPNVSDEDYLSFYTIHDIKNKRLSLVKPISNITNSTDKNYNYQKLLTLGGTLIKQGWTPYPIIKNNLLTIHHRKDDKENIINYNNRQHNLIQNLDHETICVICRDSISKFRAVVLSCSHPYHIKCLRTQLLDVGDNTSKCSLCRKEIID
jgi:hypothetical protein